MATDQIDTACDLQQTLNRTALQAQLKKSDFTRKSKTHCSECDDPIPKKRQAIGGVELCIDCQGDLEKRNR
ncbi:MAG: TraR/DksA C4-type zinc finger protein [Gammaproteobacteria bacterium]|nr:TraR/DksA C4-type zinc finger protein [Gammaproteobacteria bacterium]